MQSKVLLLFNYFILILSLFCRKFDKYAASIIDRCFDVNKDFAVNLLRRPAAAFYNVEPLTLASKANCRAFLASKSVQRYLDNEW
jgi:hypothetical protein